MKFVKEEEENTYEGKLKTDKIYRAVKGSSFHKSWIC
jgi:hypothetical protein